MRLLLHLHTRPGTILPAHYNSALSAGVPSLLRFDSGIFADYLQDIGLAINRPFYDLFSFALRFNRMQFEGDYIRMLDPFAELHISLPLIGEFITAVALDSIEKRQLRIGPALFDIGSAEILPEPAFAPNMRFTLLSPLVLSVQRRQQGSMYRYYLRAEDTEEINHVLSADLADKHRLLTGKFLRNASVQLHWDQGYLMRRQRVTRRVLMDKAHGSQDNIIGIMAPFELSGSPELIQAGYECGFGEENALGFGMAKVLEERPRGGSILPLQSYRTQESTHRRKDLSW